MPIAKRQFLVRLSVLFTLLSLAGCDLNPSQADPKRGSAAAPQNAPGPVTADDYLQVAKRLQGKTDYRGAADAVYKSLVQQPNNDEAILVAAQVERSRGNLETAADIVASVDTQSRFARTAIQLRFDLLLELDRQEQAAEVLLAALGDGLDDPQWRHDAWKLLNRYGRRAEACEQALILSRRGMVTEHELLSLTMRAYSFPTPGMLPGNQDGDRLFANGLGKAKWFFTLTDYHSALEELAEEHQSGFSDAETEAFYGRLLAETQQWNQFRQWSVKSSEQAREFADYWAATGTFFFSEQRYEAAIRALLEAVRLDPTDRISVQRLARSLLAMGREKDAKRFNDRAMQIYTTESEAQVIYIAPQQGGSRQKLTQALMALGRPFETLAWMLSMVPDNASESRRSLEEQRQFFLTDGSALDMAARKSLSELDLADFDMKPAWQELLTDDASELARPVAASREVLATPRLVNRAREKGLNFQWYNDVEINLDVLPIHEAIGGGIAVLDYDLDGWPDVYLAQGSGDPPTSNCTRSNQLFRGGPQDFLPVTSWAQADDFNYSSGLAAGDVNQDGFVDLLLGSLGHNRLLINNGDGTFRSATLGIDDSLDRFTSSVAIADINSDRLPDLFEANYIQMEGGFALPQSRADGLLLAPSPLSYTAAPDRWFENLADGRFRAHEITPEVAPPGTSLGVVITDFQSDGKNEVFVANDVRPNHLLVQSSNNRFLNMADLKGVANGFDGGPKGCMGVATGDFNRDGKIDIQVTNYLNEEANLYLQSSDGNFMDNSERYALADATRPHVGFGTKAVDIDRNGFLDIIVTNGHVFDMQKFGEAYQMPPQLLMSDGRRFQTAEVDDDSGYWNEKYLGRTIATIDYDRDGALDFIIGHLDKPLALLTDETETSGGWLQLELVGTLSERDAIGATVVLTIDGSRYIQWVTAGDGYLCSDEPVKTFGFEPSNPIGQIEVRWPSGLLQTFESVACGHRYLIVEGDSSLYMRQ